MSRPERLSGQVRAGDGPTSLPAGRACPDGAQGTASSPGPGHTTGSVLAWVLRRASAPDWSPLRPAEFLIAEVHPGDPALCRAVLRRARARLHTRATAAPTPTQRRALATLSVAINLTGEPSVDPSTGGAGEGQHGRGHPLSDYLRPGRFPADREELLAAAVHHHAPPAVLQLLMALPARRPFADLPDLLRAIGIPVMPPP